MERKILWAGIIVLVGFLVLAVLTTFNKQNEFYGVEISPPSAAPDFSDLSSQDGQNIRLESLRGKVVLLFFGYTSCPDICPATLGRLKQVVTDLGNEKDEVIVMMITTDPVRDSQAKLGDYMGNFNPDFIGLTGLVLNLEETWKNYGVTVLDDGATHSTRVYVIDQLGNLRLTFPNEMSVDAMVSDLKMLIGER
jgi:protein SCO1/2